MGRGERGHRPLVGGEGEEGGGGGGVRVERREGGGGAEGEEGVRREPAQPEESQQLPLRVSPVLSHSVRSHANYSCNGIIYTQVFLNNRERTCSFKDLYNYRADFSLNLWA